MRTLASLHHPWLGEPAKRTTTKANSSQEHHARDDQSHQCKVTSYLSSTNTTKEQKKVNNPYVKASKSASANSTEERSAAATSSSTITSEVGIEKFFVTKRGVGDAKPSAAQTLVSPGKTDAQVRGLNNAEQGGEKQHGQKRLLGFPSNDNDSDLHYHSDEDSGTSNAVRESKMDEPCKIHSKLGYHRPLDQGRLRAYRFYEIISHSP